MNELGFSDAQYRQLRRELIARYTKTLGPDQAADLVDEAITISLTSAYDPERGHREAWISGIARNLHANHWRRTARRPDLTPPNATSLATTTGCWTSSRRVRCLPLWPWPCLSSRRPI